MKKLLSAIATCLLVAVPAPAQEVKVMTAEEAYEAGLLEEPIPKLVIPLDDLGSKEELLEKIAEHSAGLEKIPWPSGAKVVEPFIPPDVADILEAIEADDDDRLRQALSDMAGGVEVRLPSDDDLRQHDEEAIYEPRERYPTDEILARMRPERVEALADYRHLLDDDWALIDALDKMDSRTRAAAREFLGKSRPPEPIEAIEAMIPPELKEQIRLAQERGWYEVDSPARGQSLLREAARLDASDGAARLARSSLSDYDEYVPGTAASYSFDMPGGGRLEVVADTVFGGVLYAEKSEAGHVYPNDPNLHILGHDASVTTSKYADGVWATTVTAFDGSYRYRITLEKKLEGENRDKFVRMATAMIERDLSR